jgi:copper resistance protein B
MIAPAASLLSCGIVLLCGGPALAQVEDTAAPGDTSHIAPAPPETPMHDMSRREMTRMMEMNDAAALGKLLVDQLEWRDGDGTSGPAWDAQAWYGTDYNKLWFKTEGVRLDGTTEEARAELLWDRIFSRWWSAQAGVRHDFGNGPPRNWLAVGVQGLAPYFFAIEATAYVGDAGRTAARFRAEYELLFTQRLILQPELELNAYGKDDPERQIGAGFSDLQLGLRLRYEFHRELAPYLGVAWLRRLGKTADLVSASGQDPSVLQLVVGIRFWF